MKAAVVESNFNRSFLVNFTNFFRITFQQNFAGWQLLKLCEMHEHWCSHFSYFNPIQLYTPNKELMKKCHIWWNLPIGLVHQKSINFFCSFIQFLNIFLLPYGNYGLLGFPEIKWGMSWWLFQHYSTTMSDL